MTDKFEDLKQALATEEGELREAEERVRHAEAAVLTHEGALVDATTEANAAKVAAAKAEVAMAQQLRDARRKRVERAKAAVEAADRELARLELESIERDLHGRVAAYEPALTRIAAVDAMVGEAAAALAKLNADAVAKWSRAQSLAQRLGDHGFAARVPRPATDEAANAARLTVARSRATAGRTGSPEALLVPLRRPEWNDPQMENFKLATRVLEQGSES